MSKEYLEALGKNIRYKKEYVGNDTYRLYIKKNEIEFLEQVLERLEAIDNASYSEALEDLDKMANQVFQADDDFEFYYNKVKQYILKAQEQDSVLKIIKEKKVNIGHFYFVVFVLKKDYESCKLNNNNVMYNICDTEKDFLTEEEFDTLKRWLENDTL